MFKQRRCFWPHFTNFHGAWWRKPEFGPLTVWVQHRIQVLIQKDCVCIQRVSLLGFILVKFWVYFSCILLVFSCTDRRLKESTSLQLLLICLIRHFLTIVSFCFPAARIESSLLLCISDCGSCKLSGQQPTLNCSTHTILCVFQFLCFQYIHV